MSLPPAHLVRLNAVLTQRQLSALKVAACYGLSVPERLLETAVLFTDVYRLVDEYYPSGNGGQKDVMDCSSVMVQILSRIGVPERYLFSLREKARQSNGPYVPDLIREQPLLDLILTVNSILDSLPENKYRSLKELAFRMFFPQSNSSVITSRTGLVEFLLRNNILSLRAFDYVFAWLEVIGSSIYRQYLARFCDCQRINTPNWKPLLPAVKKVFSTFCTQEELYETTSKVIPLNDEYRGGDYNEALSVSLPNPAPALYCYKHPKEEVLVKCKGNEVKLKEPPTVGRGRCLGCFLLSLIVLVLVAIALLLVFFFFSDYLHLKPVHFEFANTTFIIG